jgi:hypothetical protein
MKTIYYWMYSSRIINHTWLNRSYFLQVDYICFSELTARRWTHPILWLLYPQMSNFTRGKVEVKWYQSSPFAYLRTTPWRLWWSGGIAPRILKLGTLWRWMVSFTPRPLYPQRNCTWYPLDRRLGGPQSRSGRGGEEKKIPAPTGNRNLIVQTVA